MDADLGSGGSRFAITRVTRASGLLALALSFVIGCGPSTDGADRKQWTVVRNDLDRVPLCVWGAAPGDVWIGGGGLAVGGPALLMHGDGRSWVEEGIDAQGTLWWIHGSSANDVWAVGERGLALHWDGSAWEARPTGTEADLYGVWAFAPDDVWFVGGSPLRAGPTDVLLHFDGVSFRVVPPPRVVGATYFKVWGLSPSDVLVVASAGLALHYDGNAWSEVETGSRATLFTVHGTDAVVRSIGGPPAVLLRWNGQRFDSEPTPQEMSGAMTGVFVDASGTTFLTGERYQRYERDASGTFRNDTDSPALFGDLHAVWGDGQGNAVAVGGNYVALTRPDVAPRGEVVRYGN